MATIKKTVKKAQSGDSTSKKDPDIQPWMAALNKQTRAEMKNPKLGDERRRKEDSTRMANYKQDTARRNAFHRKEGDLVQVRPSGSTSITIMPKKKNDGFKNGGKAKNGKQMIKRADGSVSQRGLWDNIRAAKGSGKKPTAAMLKQEKKIKAKTKK